MTTYDYYSIPLRIGILITALSCLAIANMVFHLSDAMDVNVFKCMIALWSLVGLVGCDVSKNGIRQWQRQLRLIEPRAQSSKSQPEVMSGGRYGMIDPREYNAK